MSGEKYPARVVRREFVLGEDDQKFEMRFVNRIGIFPQVTDRKDVVNEIDGCIQQSALGKFHF